MCTCVVTTARRMRRCRMARLQPCPPAPAGRGPGLAPRSLDAVEAFAQQGRQHQQVVIVNPHVIFLQAAQHLRQQRQGQQQGDEAEASETRTRPLPMQAGRAHGSGSATAAAGKVGWVRAQAGRGAAPHLHQLVGKGHVGTHVRGPEVGVKAAQAGGVEGYEVVKDGPQLLLAEPCTQGAGHVRRQARAEGISFGDRQCVHGATSVPALASAAFGPAEPLASACGGRMLLPQLCSMPLQRQLPASPLALPPRSRRSEHRANPTPCTTHTQTRSLRTLVIVVLQVGTQEDGVAVELRHQLLRDLLQAERSESSGSVTSSPELDKQRSNPAAAGAPHPAGQQAQSQLRSQRRAAQST